MVWKRNTPLCWMEGRVEIGVTGRHDGRSRRVEFSVPVLYACLGCHESRLQRNHAGRLWCLNYWWENVLGWLEYCWANVSFRLIKLSLALMRGAFKLGSLHVGGKISRDMDWPEGRLYLREPVLYIIQSFKSNCPNQTSRAMAPEDTQDRSGC